MILYNSFLEQYKNPFGAVSALTSVTFQIQIQAVPQFQEVHLIVYRDEYWDAPVSEIKLNAGANHLFMATFQPKDPGLYYYFFTIKTASTIIYYGCQDGGFGGVGVEYPDRSSVQMYQLTCLKAVDHLPDWYKDAVFYHIFVDRFYNGNTDGHVNDPKSNSFIYGTKADLPYYVKNQKGDIVRWDFYGGNLRGIEKKLPYLQELGITALYLSPIFEARSNHRYDTGDYKKIDSVLGTLADFEHFLNSVHKIGMHVILDGVFNHVGADSRYFNLYHTYESVGAANSKDSPYYDWFTFKHYPDDYDSWWGVLDLPAVNKDSQSFHDFIAKGDNSVIGYWTKLGVDGWRLDVADELHDDFIYQIRHQLDQYPQKVLIGEVWEDASHKIAYGKRRHYIEGDALEAVMNYPFRKLLLDLLNQVITPKDFVKQVMTLKENYPRTVFFHNFNNIGSHDTRRALTALNNDKEKLHLLFEMFFTMPGVPCIYYGDEVGVTGGIDPDNRRFFPWHHEDREIQGWVKTLIELRKDESIFNNDSELFLFAGEHWLGYIRQAASGAYRLCLLNPSNHPLMLKDENVDASALTPQMNAFIKRETLGITLDPYEFKIL